MSADAQLDELIDSVADGDQVDWAALEAKADADVLQLLAHVKMVAMVADVHRAPMDEELVATNAGPDTSRVGLGELGRWGHLQLVRKIGEGLYGEVYHARDTWLDHPVALKLLRPALSDRVLPTKLLDEARVLVKVRHPNVVAVHGADLQQGRVGFWMEFVQGQRLDDLVALQGVLSAEETAAIGQELCSALTAVHDAGLVHRDVKAQNVIREPKGRVVLMDFGAGQLMTDAVRGGGAGTPLYLAPEMFAGGPATVQTDVYALGVLLYYLVTANYPVPARSIEELTKAHAQRRQRPLLVARPGLPRRFVNVVERMIAVDPAERYHTAAEALSALRRFTAPASIARTAVKWLVAVGLGVVVLTALGLVNTAAFNAMLGRSKEFDPSQSLVTWFGWGVASTFPTAFYTGIWAAILTLLVGIWRLCKKVFPPLDVAASQCRTWCAHRASEYGLDDPTLALHAIVGAATVLLIVLVSVYWDYGGGLLASSALVNDVTADRLAAMQPANEYRLDLYGRLLDLWLLLFGIATIRTLAWARRVNSSVSRGARALAITLPMVALVFWQYPYRLMYQSAFERVDLGDIRCYSLGTNAANLLLHCPDVAPPRNRLVPVGDGRLHRRGVVESMFLPAQLSQPTQ